MCIKKHLKELMRGRDTITDNVLKWHCAYCRQQTQVELNETEDYLKLSTDDYGNSLWVEKNVRAKDPIKRLADCLGLSWKEMMNVRRLQPIVCGR
ncbi:hypothetical protein RFI_27082, partial [Reticulomyxa filosa]